MRNSKKPSSVIEWIHNLKLMVKIEDFQTKSNLFTLGIVVVVVGGCRSGGNGGGSGFICSKFAGEE